MRFFGTIPANKNNRENAVVFLFANPGAKLIADTVRYDSMMSWTDNLFENIAYKLRWIMYAYR